MGYIYNIEDLDFDKVYTYTDYLMWKFKERVELFRGKIFKMSPAPATKHQRISRKINRILDNFFYQKKCELFYAPFDVRLPNKNGEILSVVQPDLCVICDESKLDERGCLGAPDLVIEILSPGNSKKEMSIKYDLYQESGVLEYWLVHPTEKTIYVFILENGKFIGLKPFTEGQTVTSTTFPSLSFPIDEIFEG